MMLMNGLHGFVIVVDAIACMLLITGEEWIDHEAESLLLFGNFLVLVDHEIEQINRFNSIVVVL